MNISIARVVKIKCHLSFIPLHHLFPAPPVLTPSCSFFLQIIQNIFKQLSYAFLIFPQFSFGHGLMQLARLDIEVQLLSGYGIDAYKNPFSSDALGWMFISSFIQGLVFFTLRLLLNRFLIRKIRLGKQKSVADKTLVTKDNCIQKEQTMFFFWVSAN